MVVSLEENICLSLAARVTVSPVCVINSDDPWDRGAPDPGTSWPGLGGARYPMSGGQATGQFGRAADLCRIAALGANRARFWGSVGRHRTGYDRLTARIRIAKYCALQQFDPAREENPVDIILAPDVYVNASVALGSPPEQVVRRVLGKHKGESKSHRVDHGARAPDAARRALVQGRRGRSAGRVDPGPREDGEARRRARRRRLGRGARRERYAPPAPRAW